MNETQFLELMNLLKNIEMKLNVLVKLLKTIMPKPKITPEEKKILKLCDKKNTIDNMMKKTGKTRTNVKFILSQLRSKGLIESTKIKDKLVYRRI